ncbi:hypothetical protein [Solimonas terrae]|uniref:Uncharacterized protein n=1 Tax=Solimonas terrae TaxID=1396819 RepID=A0A6M2BRU3_9GAMM|nr:hypothetical protein [Solimonas terrae]NGY05208.1 hypothetical protein [Solimonas terrae]
MTLATFITLSDFDELVDAAFRPEAPRVASSESELGEALHHYADAAAIKVKAAQCVADGTHNYAFALHYPSTGRIVIERKVRFDPPRDGHTFRHSWSGWGLIHLHVYVSEDEVLQCRVAATSRAWAEKRQDRYPELGPVSDWNWPQIESIAFRLGRRLAAMGKTGPVVQPSDVWQAAAQRLRHKPDVT